MRQLSEEELINKLITVLWTKCKRCGKNLFIEFNYCPYCGKKKGEYMKKKIRKRKYTDQTKHPDLKEMNNGQLIMERKNLKEIIHGINVKDNPGMAIFHSSRLQQIEEILKRKGFLL